MTATDRAARTARLTAAARVRSADTEARARRAIARLHNSGRPITFTAIAQAAGVSTSFLYQHRELRADIIGRRNSHAPNTKAQTVSPATMDSCAPSSPPRPRAIVNWQNTSGNSPQRIRPCAAACLSPIPRGPMPTGQRSRPSI